MSLRYSKIEYFEFFWKADEIVSFKDFLTIPFANFAKIGVLKMRPGVSTKFFFKMKKYVKKSKSMKNFKLSKLKYIF